MAVFPLGLKGNRLHVRLPSGEPQFPIELGDPWISTSCFSKSDVLGGCFLVQISGARVPDWGHQPLAFLEEVSSW